MRHITALITAWCLHIILVFVALIASNMAYASGSTTYKPTYKPMSTSISTAFATLPVQYEGRMMPLDTLARRMLGRLCPNHTLPIPAEQWLAYSLFQPAEAMELPSICIAQDDVASLLALKANTPYNFIAVNQAFTNNPTVIMRVFKRLATEGENALTDEEQALVALYQAVQDYNAILQGITLLLPLQLEITPEERSLWQLPTTGLLTYQDLLHSKDLIAQTAKQALAKHANNLKHYTQTERKAASLVFTLAVQESGAKRYTLLRIIPEYLGDSTQWHAPWTLAEAGAHSPQAEELLAAWQQLAISYVQHDATKQLHAITTIKSLTSHVNTSANWQLILEYYYHIVPWAAYIMLGFAVAFGLYGISFAVSSLPKKSLHIGISKLATTCLLLTIIAFTTLIAARIGILLRPPVSTLYESVLFVAWVVAMLGIIAAPKLKPEQTTIIRCLIAAISAALLAVADTLATEGDTLGVLIAVLNTNFWLATHVICITLGYACAILAGSMAHIALYHIHKEWMRPVQTLTLIALMLTALGTILGGIWADQSWGRFWGWDPKENGALLIVLWLIWVLHGKLGGQLGKAAYLALLGAVNIIVALAWFGVNLLSVGLHSYGFIEGVAIGLFSFCAGEAVLLTVLYIHAHKRLA